MPPSATHLQAVALEAATVGNMLLRTFDRRATAAAEMRALVVAVVVAVARLHLAFDASMSSGTSGTWLSASTRPRGRRPLAVATRQSAARRRCRRAARRLLSSPIAFFIRPPSVAVVGRHTTTTRLEAATSRQVNKKGRLAPSSARSPARPPD